MAVATSLIDAPPPASAWEQIRLLLWLKMRMTLRGFQRSRSAIVGTVLSVLIFLPFTWGLGVAAGILFATSPAHFAGQTLLVVLVAIYLIWLIGPLLGFQLNDSYDITRLFVYPVSLRRLFVGGILGSILDTPTLLLLPALIGTMVGYSCRGVLAAVMAVLIVPLFLFHTLALSQATLLATAGVLRSRKWRDFAIVAVPLFWVGYQVFNKFILPNYLGRLGWRHFLDSPLWNIAGFLPPGCGARAISSAATGAYLPAIGYLLALAVYTGATIYLASWLIGKAYEGDDVSILNVRRARKPDSVATRRTETEASRTGDSLITLPPVMAAMIEKEIRYYVRDPYFRLALVNTIYLLVIGVFTSYNTSHTGHTSHSAHRHPMNPDIGGMISLWTGTSLLLLQQATLVYNQFGTDGGAAPVLLGFPASRRQILMGKNLPLFLALAAENIIIGVILCFLFHTADTMPLLLLWLIFALGVMFAIGNVMSVLFPYKIVVKGFRTQRMAGMGAATGFLYFGVTLLALILFVPVLAAILIPWYGWFEVSRGWLSLTLPVAAAYVAGLYILSLKLAEYQMLKKEPEIIEKVYRAPA